MLFLTNQSYCACNFDCPSVVAVRQHFPYLFLHKVLLVLYLFVLFSDGGFLFNSYLEGNNFAYSVDLFFTSFCRSSRVDHFSFHLKVSTVGFAPLVFGFYTSYIVAFPVVDPR